MASNSMPYKPWLHQQNHSSSSVAGQGMEISIPPGLLPPRPTSYQDYSINQLPPLPKEIYENQFENENTRTWETPIHHEMMASSPIRISRELKRRSVLPSRPKSHSSRNSVQLPSPPMIKSPQKILQLAGYDLRLVKDYQQSPVPLSPVSSDSSGSVYSQPADQLQGEATRSAQTWGSGASTPSAAYENGSYLTPAVYNSSVGVTSTQKPAISPRHWDRASGAQPRNEEDFSTQLKTVPKLTAEEVKTLQDLLAEERRRYDQSYENDLRGHVRNDLAYPEFGSLVPRPLTLRAKANPEHISINSRPGLLRNARESLEWGLTGRNQINPPGNAKRYRTPTSPMFSMPSGHLILPEIPQLPISSQPKWKRFGNGDHPLKSPFPFPPTPSHEEEDTVSSPKESKFSKGLSGAMRHLSGGSGKSPSLTKRSVMIPNWARKADGPDTPILPKTGFMAFLPTVDVNMMEKGNELVVKAKKSVKIKSGQERRREDLRKKIVVIGITDQSPGIYYSLLGCK
jgi:hypothetical protein